MVVQSFDKWQLSSQVGAIDGCWFLKKRELNIDQFQKILNHRGYNAPWFICWFRHYINRLLPYLLKNRPFRFQAGGRGHWPNVALVSCVYFVLSCHGCMFDFAVLYLVFSTMPRDWLGRTSTKWPTLCPVERKTLTQSINLSSLFTQCHWYMKHLIHHIWFSLFHCICDVILRQFRGITTFVAYVSKRDCLRLSEIL